jgi:hypothetical protein
VIYDLFEANLLEYQEKYTLSNLKVSMDSFLKNILNYR